MDGKDLQINGEYAKLYFKENAEKQAETKSANNPLEIFTSEYVKEYYDDFKSKSPKNNQEQSSQQEVKAYSMPNPHRLRNKRAQERKEKAKSIRDDFEKTKSQQGCIGSAWDSTKNFFGMKTGSEYVESQIKALENGKISKVTTADWEKQYILVYGVKSLRGYGN